MDQTGAFRIKQLIGKYGSIFLVLFVGIVLMLLPNSVPAINTEAHSIPMENKESTLQEQLSEILSLVEGAGKVRILLTIDKGERTYFQEDQNSSGTDTVILSDASRNQGGLIRQIDPPTYMGAIVICQGADSASVRYSVTQAVSNTTGLGFDRIIVMKMK